MIRLKTFEKPPVNTSNEALMFRLIRASFNQRRKTLVNGLNNSPELDFSKDEITGALEKLGVSPNVRGEVLTLRQFARLADILSM